MMFSSNIWLPVTVFFQILLLVLSKTNRPNIILIIADDLGWNDVGFHGTNQIPTSNIDALAYHGIILNRHYVLPTCTPSRASLMTGKYAIRTGLQGDPGKAASPWALPIGEKILPQYLKDLGYKTHLIGKWHLGFYRQEFTPTKRGFDTHFGYYNGWVRYNDSVTEGGSYKGYDSRRNLLPAVDETIGRYLTDVYTEEAIKIIKNHNRDHPLFLDISHVAVHAAKNNILQVANMTENDKKFHYIPDKFRRLFAGILNSLDKSVGKVIEALDEAKMLENSIIIFMADNGGSTIDPDWLFTNTASNWPLRGMKTSFFDGGVRGTMAVWSPLLKHKNVVSNELFHITDWLPTLIAAAGNSSYVPSFADNYDGIPGRSDSEIPYSMESVLQSLTNKILTKYSSPEEGIRRMFEEIRLKATIDGACKKRIKAGRTPPIKHCNRNLLFDLEKDPCEFQNIEAESPAVVKILKARLDYFEMKTVDMQIFAEDPRADPKNFDGYWSWWVDFNEDLNNGIVIVSSGLAIVAAIVLFKIR